MPVVKLFWCVALEPLTGSKCKPGQGQWALKLESCCDVIKTLFSTAMAGQDNASAQKERERLQRMQIFHLRCHNFEPNRPAGVVVKHIAIGEGGFGFDFWAGTDR